MLSMKRNLLQTAHCDCEQGGLILRQPDCREPSLDLGLLIWNDHVKFCLLFALNGQMKSLIMGWRTFA
jgi:hypothetical protein